MKKITLLFCLFLGLFLVGYSQAYTPFPENKGFWKVGHHGLQLIPGAPSSDLEGYSQYTMDGDTLIGFKSYKKISSVHESFNWSNVGPPPLDPFPLSYYFFEEYVGGIRNDTPSKQVYFMPKDSVNEVLLYDFNLSLGDTLPLSFIYDGSFPVIINVIDSINSNGQFFKRYHLQGAGWGLGDYLIEGIGSTFGLLSPIETFFEHSNDLVCFKYNDTIIEFKGTSSYYSCDVITGLNPIKTTQSLDFNIIPNPTTGVLYINNNNIQVTSIDVLDITGKTVQSFLNTKKMIDLSHLQSGIYFLKINNSVTKIILE